MTEPTTPPPPAPEPEQPAEPRRGWSRKSKVILWGILLLPFLLFTLYSLLVLNWSYSDGWRSGVLQKFSRKGWICKTWEGELAMSTVPGVAPTIWIFSVRDDAVTQRMSDAVGERVDLHYTEHRGIPSDCFASTNYFVDSVRTAR
jgi:hypothetical protein